MSATQITDKGMLIRKINRQEPIAKQLTGDERSQHPGDRAPRGPAADRRATL